MLILKKGETIEITTEGKSINFRARISLLIGGFVPTDEGISFKILTLEKNRVVSRNLTLDQLKEQHYVEALNEF